MLQAHINNIWINKNHSKQPLLKTIDFRLIKGKVYTILGKNGSGKSTLIKSLTRLLNESSLVIEGKVFFEDQDLLSCNQDELRQIRINKIRYVFQDASNSFDPLKTFKYYFENISTDKNNIEDILKYFLLPAYDYISGLFPYEISGGMAQRLGFAMAFITKPKFIILDEPTTGIDYAIANLLLLKIREYAQKENGTVLIVTHDINFAEKVSDELAFLSDGTISEFKIIEDFFTGQNSETLNSFMKAYEEMK